MSPSVSLVRALAARELGDSRAPGKESARRREKHQEQANPGKLTLRSGAAARGAPLGTHSRRAGHNPRGYRGAARPQQHGACSLARRNSFQAPVLANTAGGAALRNGTGGATAAMVSTMHRVATQFTSLPSLLFITPLHASNHLDFFFDGVTVQPRNWATRSLSSATLQPGRRRGIFTQLTKRAR